MSVTDKKHRMSKLGRRGFLGASAATLGLGLVGAPTLWIPRRARASTPAFGMVKHLIVINADGGMRSTSLFNSDVSDQWNPSAISGVQSGASGTDWGVGGVFSSSAHDGGIVGDVASVPMWSDEICVLGTVDHTPGTDKGDGDHATAKLRMATGQPDGTTGVLTRIYREHALYQDGGIDTNLPPVTIGDGGRRYGSGAGEWGPYRPVAVAAWSDFRGKSGQNAADEPGWAVDFERATDDWFAAQRSAYDRARVDGQIDAKSQAITFRPIFTDPILDVELLPDEAMHGVSNGELVAALGQDRVGLEAALALRFCGFGAPAVVIGDGGWDFHSDELAEFPAKGRALGRTLSGLRWALKNLQHPDGGTYWDHSLVVVVSEFGRDNVEANGFNSGNGSDHHGTPACRYQALPFFGGVIDQAGTGGKFFGATDSTTMEPKGGEPVFSSLSVLSTMLDVVGIDFADHFPDAPIDTLFG